MVKAFLVMVFLKLNSVRSLARVLINDSQLAKACGLGNQVPSYRTLTRRFKSLESPVIDFARQVVQVLVKYRIVSLRAISTDASLLEAKGKPSQRKNPEVKPSDPNARWGWSKTRGWVFGYKLHLTSTVLVKGQRNNQRNNQRNKEKKAGGKIKQTLIPLVWKVSSANRHDGKLLLPLMAQADILAKECQRRIQYSLADKGYDDEKLFQECKTKGFRLLAPPREMRTRTRKPVKPSKIRKAVIKFLKTKKGKQLYYRRADTERLFGHFKDLFLIDPLPVIRITNVKPYLALINLAYLLAVLYNHLNGRSLRAIKSLTT